ncbi:MAG TPA: hypothetical protein VK427_10855 [Kofleriaceae bacterium]|nr:hypothetical protein [Kofleriaceae bacterium]
MKRVSLLFVASLVACGGGKSKQQNLAPLPEPPAEAKAEPKPEPAPEPPKQLPPLEVKVELPAVTVKLVNGGKGKKAALKYTAKAGTKQAVEVVMSFAQTASVDGQSDSQVVPTIVLTGEAETKAVDANGRAEYTFAVASTDARDVQGAAVPVDKFKTALASLAGLVISGAVDPNGVSTETTMRIEKPDPLSTGALDLVKVTLPGWPVLPKEPVGVGAKWQTTANTVLRAAPGDKGIEMTHVTTYELVSRKGTTSTIKSKTTVSGKDQEYNGGKISKINGTGTSQITLEDGVLYPTAKSAIETNLTASEKEKSMQLAFKIGGEINTKAAGTSAPAPTPAPATPAPKQ